MITSLAERSWHLAHPCLRPLGAGYTAALLASEERLADRALSATYLMPDTGRSCTRPWAAVVGLALSGIILCPTTSSKLWPSPSSPSPPPCSPPPVLHGCARAVAHAMVRVRLRPPTGFMTGATGYRWRELGALAFGLAWQIEHESWPNHTPCSLRAALLRRGDVLRLNAPCWSIFSKMISPGRRGFHFASRMPKQAVDV